MSGLLLIGYATLWSMPSEHMGLEKSLQLSLLHVSPDHLVALRVLVPATWYLETISFDADIPGVTEQAAALCGLKEHTTVQCEDLYAGLSRLSKQRRFAAADIAIVHLYGTAYAVHIYLHAALVVGRVHMSGTLFGKDRYRQCYLLKAGAVFDEHMHQEGLRKIREALQNDGYFSAEVVASYDDDVSRKIRDITLYVQQKRPFSIGIVQVTLDSRNNEIHERDLHLLTHKIRASLQKSLQGSCYSRNALNFEIRSLKHMLVDQGFLSNTITLEERIIPATTTVDLTLRVCIDTKHLCVFHGNRFFSRAQLLDAIMLFGTSALLIPPSILADEIRTLYVRKGFWDVVVSGEEDGSNVHFFITEGKRVRVQDIVIEGVSYTTAACLRALFGKPLLRARYFDDSLVQEMRDNITQFYIRHGFWDMRFHACEYRQAASGASTVVMTIAEGAQRWLTSVIREHMDGISDDQLTNVLWQIQSPIPFDIDIIKKQRHELQRALRMQGRLYANPIPSVSEELAGHTIHWTCGGMQDIVTFGKTIIQHNDSVPSAILERELAYREGEPWDAEKLHTTLDRIKGLGIYDVVTLVPDDITRPELSKNLLLTCIADASYEFRVRLGGQGVNRNVVKWRGGASYKCGVSAIIRNPTYQADIVRADVDISRYMHDVALIYRIPHAFAYPMRTELQVFSSRYDQPLFIGSPEVLYRIDQSGMLASVSNVYGPLSGGLSIGGSWDGLSTTPCTIEGHGSRSVLCGRERAVASALDLNERLFGPRLLYVWLESTVLLDYRNDKINPSYGHVTMGALKVVIPPTHTEGAFIKVLLEQSCFISIGRFAICAMRLRGGALGPAALQNILPSERFYLGGPWSVRGYESDYAPPLNPLCTCSEGRCLVPTGGKAMLNINAEIRFPMYQQLWGAIFFDGGALSTVGVATIVRPHTLMAVFVGGLRFITVIGPLRCDVGWKVSPDHTITGFPVHDRRYAWFITLGQAF